MTQSARMRDRIVGMLTTAAERQSESAATARKRRIVVVAVMILGAATLGFSLNQQPGDPTFYWLTFLLAAIWAGGAFLSGPLHLGRISWRDQAKRPVVTGLGVGILLGGVFVVGALIVRQIDPIAEFITRVLVFANQGALWLVVVITLVNGVAEELFFRGSLYTALGDRAPVVISTIMYIIATLASGNPMLGFAAIILGTVCALERRATGGVLAPILTHLVWGLIMVLALPPLFGV